MNKLNLAIIFGGKSVEHEISLISAKNIMKSINKNKYRILPIGINKNGSAILFSDENCFENYESPKTIKLSVNKSLGNIYFKFGSNKIIVENNDKYLTENIDIVFPIVHGTGGEDGSLQGFIKSLNIPFVGSDVLGSSICMDKVITKRILESININVSKYIVLRKNDTLDLDKYIDILKLPIFVKPSNTGSSVGINKAKTKEQLLNFIKEAFEFDNKIILEEYIKGREIEVSVLGNREPIVSIAGEIIPQYEFYSYKAKYIDENGAILEIPAKIENNILTQIQNIAIKAYRELECYGLARVDFFLTNENKIYLNEINTLPGFTSISMYPKLLSYSNITYSEIIDKLINFAIERFKEEKNIKRTYT
ncbi:MAG: D-alanine--D-alanine ligase A [Candidatus Sericytochromatia bacterium]|nr:MAG: D-alanine--D-alanine ligase A [Candidatus Sericytochromatia bacterium]